MSEYMGIIKGGYEAKVYRLCRIIKPFNISTWLRINLYKHQDLNLKKNQRLRFE